MNVSEISQAHTIEGTGRVGTLLATREQIEALLGPPHVEHSGPFAKTTHEWHCRFVDGTVFTLYDYHHNRAAEYSIGGVTRRAAAIVRVLFGPTARAELHSRFITCELARRQVK